MAKAVKERTRDGGEFMLCLMTFMFGVDIHLFIVGRYVRVSNSDS